MQPRLAPRLSAWVCLLVIAFWSVRNAVQAHINITWADNSTDSLTTADFFNLRVPYYEKQGTLIFRRMKRGTCEYGDMRSKDVDMLKEHLARTGTKQDVAILLDRMTFDNTNCHTVIQVSACHANWP